MGVIRKTLFLLLTVASAAVAQRPDTASVCWRPQPLANCKTWVVTEAALEMPMSSTSTSHLLVGYPNGEGYVSNDFGARLAFTIGLMVNRGEKSGRGVNVSMLNGELPGRIEARYHRWLAPDHGLDLGLGVTSGRVRGAYDPDESPTRGVTTAIGISNTYIAADVRFDLAHATNDRMVHATYLTARSGSRAGPIVAASGFLLFLGLFALATRGGDY